MLIENCPMFRDELFTRENDRLIVHLEKLDLFSYFDGDTKALKMDENLSPYSDLKIWMFDLETEGLDPDIHAIKMIGNKLSNSKYLMMDWTKYTESEMIQYFFHLLLDVVKPDILTGYNIWKFDIPFLIRRCQILGIRHPFRGGKLKTFRTAQKFGKPQEFNQYWLNNIDIIDCYLQVLSKDFSERKLTGHSLKVVPAQWGLRDDIRVELSYNQMLECYRTNNAELMTKYLKDDLDDTHLICDVVLPEIYYQKLFLDWKLQSLATSGNGSKWNSILANFYGYEPKPDPKLKFRGGFTQGIAGIFYDVEKLDVSSLYPSIMLSYGICSRKDPLAYQLKLLRYLRDRRLSLKRIANDDKEADRMQSALKIFINSAYGFLGVTGCSFNDMRAASLVTAYGERIVKYMEKLILDKFGIPIEIDTDGIIYGVNGQDGAIIHKYLNDNMPKGIDIDRERLGGDKYSADLLFVPPVMDKKGIVTYIDEDYDPEKARPSELNFDDLDSKGNVLGLSKNYALLTKKDITFKVIAKGKYRKRNLSEFEKTFQINLLKTLLSDGKEACFAYYQDTLKTISEGKLSYESIKVSRKAAKSEKDVFVRGLVDDEGIATYYQGREIVQMKRKVKPQDCKVNKGLYSVNFYTEFVKRQFSEIQMFL